MMKWGRRIGWRWAILGRIKWRWAILGSTVWLILLSSISLQEGHPKLAQWTGTAAIAVAVLGVLVAVLRLLTRLILASTHTLYRRVTRRRRRLQNPAAVGRRTPIRR